MILGIETSADQCAVGLVGDRVFSRAEAMARGHSDALMPMIDAVLAEANAAFENLERIGVCTGPGSFTGVRVGVAAARGLALGLGIPAVGISRLHALAHQHGAGPVTISLPMRPGTRAEQDFDAELQPANAPRLIERADQPEDPASDFRADPVIIARLAAEGDTSVRPAPLYLRPADAAPSKIQPPVMLGT
ncbi:MAG: tRNA (adenosine(37)-N6)-threonylcarbamoyltransferase complex dimerization subunit type 1 TsaB [Pseudomonadota bacterium]